MTLSQPVAHKPVSTLEGLEHTKEKTEKSQIIILIKSKFNFCQ